MFRRRLYLVTLRSGNPALAQYREAVTLCLTLAAFEHEVSVLYLGDGVFRLLPGQDTRSLEVKDCSGMPGSFADHGIGKIYVLDQDLQRRGLDAAALLRPVTVLDCTKLRALMQAQDFILHM